MDDDHENTNRDARHGSARVHPVRNSIREWVEERVGGEFKMGNAAKQSSNHEEKTVRLAHTHTQGVRSIYADVRLQRATGVLLSSVMRARRLARLTIDR